MKLRSVVLFALMAAPAATQAQASTFLQFDSQPGDYIGGGRRFTLTPADGTIRTSRVGAGVEVAFSGQAGWWSLDFVPRSGAELVPGVYEGATRWPFQSPTSPGLAVSGEGRGCNTLTGRFSVLEAEYGAGGAVVRLAIDYEQHCEGGGPALYGSVRIDSAITATPRLSIAPASAYEGDAGVTNLRFALTLSAPAQGAVLVDYHTVDGSATAGSDYHSTSGTATFAVGQTTVTVPVPVIGDSAIEPDETLSLALDGASGAPVAFASAPGTILNDDPDKTFLFFDSQAGDYIGQGRRFTLTPSDGTITATRTGGGVHVGFDGSTWWDLYFVPPSGVQLVPGVYEGATRWPFQSPAGPGLDASGDGRGCNSSTGRFAVLEAEYGASGEVARLAIDYEQHCDGGGPALFGAVRISSSLAATPRLSASSALGYEGDTGTTDLRFVVSLSAPAANAVTVDYRTANGTATAGSDYEATSGTATFAVGQTAVTLAVPVRGDTEIEADETFSLALQGAAGAPLAFAGGQGTILNDDPYKTFLFFDSQGGDYIGQGRRFTLTALDGALTTSRSAGGVHVAFDGSTWWDLYFEPPSGAQLSPGVYEGASRWPFQSPSAPGMDVSGDGRGCNRATGRFTVLEAEYGPGGEVVRLAVDYEQHCEGGAPALFGAVRIRSSVPAAARLSVSSARAYEGDSGATDLRFVVSLSRPATSPVSVDFRTADGSATDGSDYRSTSGTASFAVGQTAVVLSVPVTGDTASEPDETFAIEIDAAVGASIAFGAGQGTIVNDDPYKTLVAFHSQGGDYIGQGRRFTLTPLDGAIAATREGAGVHVAFDGETWWDLYFAPPSTAQLVPGAYEGATRWPFQAAGVPGLSVSGDGRGCNALTGRFSVLEVEYGASGELLRLAVDYEQHCEGQGPALFGAVRFNSSVPVVYVSLASGTLTEGDAGTRDLDLTVSLSQAASGPVTVSFAMRDGTATRGTDYGAFSGSLVVPAGQTSASIAVPVFGDTLSEADETFDVDLTAVRGGMVGSPSSASFTILDDDPLPQLAVNDVVVVEGNPGGSPTQAVFTVSLSALSGQAVSTSYLTQPGSATAGDDLGYTSGVVTFAPGVGSVLLNVPINPDAVDEGDETFRLLLVAPLHASIGDGEGTATITDDDRRLGFYTVPPCRLLDTRVAGPAVAANAGRNFAGVGACGIPITARALAVTVAAVDPTELGHLQLYPAGQTPNTSVLNFPRGRTRAGNAVVGVGTAGMVTVKCGMATGSTGSTHVIVDVSGYFQ